MIPRMPEEAVSADYRERARRDAIIEETREGTSFDCKELLIKYIQQVMMCTAEHHATKVVFPNVLTDADLVGLAPLVREARSRYDDTFKQGAW